jgi:MFS family permease
VSRAEILRNGPLRALLAAEVISTTGAQMTWLALPWFVLVTTDSPAQMTLVMIAELVGLTAAGLPSGALLQRLGARRTMLAADAIRAPLMLLVPVLHWSGNLSFPVLLGLAFALGTFGAPYFAAQRLIVPELLGEDESVVTQANALFQGAIRATLLLGPPVAGVLIGIFGAPSVLLIDAATYVVSFVLVQIFVPRRAPLPVEDTTRGVLAGNCASSRASPFCACGFRSS